MNFPKTHELAAGEGRSAFGENLLAWYDDHRRDLPWRKQPSLYKTVVSEFMLQQTRVATVLPYFERWLKQFPDFAALADASEEAVLKAWEGLGYYSRARNLRKLAQQIEALEKIPADSAAWEGFPGVGPYVAAAVTSISFGTKAAVVDGNVVRVLARMLSIDEQFRDNATAQRKLRPIAQELLHYNRPGDYNQAVMELGATVCHRRSPLCSDCPALYVCQSGQRGDPESYPRTAKKSIERITVDRLWITCNNSLLLREAPADSKRLAGLMELPKLEDLPTVPKPGKTALLAIKKRSISNQSIEERIYRAELPHGFNLKDCPELRLTRQRDLGEITLSAPHRRWIESLLPK
uniref:Putative HhH-GPD superfamily base excision DNA repair protein n=1 Tax=uncultured marine microorganism HF4000_APKG3D20 TaxID=455549 RepID=B3T7B3_9ZZZZ|nr:putative HhH-GPD superfamily base excision DNA repair protein [uncultured marine microorganism HF4000_APKG3D20]